MANANSAAIETKAKTSSANGTLRSTPGPSSQGFLFRPAAIPLRPAVGAHATKHEAEAVWSDGAADSSPLPASSGGRKPTPNQSLPLSTADGHQRINAAMRQV